MGLRKQEVDVTVAIVVEMMDRTDLAVTAHIDVLPRCVKASATEIFKSIIREHLCHGLKTGAGKEHQEGGCDEELRLA
jgi:hypothetical protein